jgi:hypothetical protein
MWISRFQNLGGLDHCLRCHEPDPPRTIILFRLRSSYRRYDLCERKAALKPLSTRSTKEVFATGPSPGLLRGFLAGSACGVGLAELVGVISE